MPVLKTRISAPLEAGSSLLQTHLLPPALDEALHYISARLARKSVHVTMIVVRKDVALPSDLVAAAPSSPSWSSASPSASPLPSPALSPATPLSPTSSIFSSTSIKSSSPLSFSFARVLGSPLPSPRNASPASLASSSSCPSPTSSISSFTSYSPATITTPRSTSCNINLLPATSLDARSFKILSQTMHKTAKKFPGIGSSWLSPACLVTQPPSVLTRDLIHHSLAQNHILFAAEGLSLLALDQLYVFKSILCAYAAHTSFLDRTRAVDELRRLVLAQQGRPIMKATILRSYEYLRLSSGTLADVNESYKASYGGPKRASGIDMGVVIERRFPVSKPVLKMKTQFPSPVSGGVGEFGMEPLREDRGPHLRGPMTPNGGDDISPVTKGEWGFLVGELGGRNVGVETC
ncbi:hypothetical protein F5884DRAFT_451455 [Xylogone sp. PMI_703]|nr:hypothetical protein F5884DRAFT_451455 [Xylogone sp. PMI_703]